MRAVNRLTIKINANHELTLQNIKLNGFFERHMRADFLFNKLIDGKKIFVNKNV